MIRPPVVRLCLVLALFAPTAAVHAAPPEREARLHRPTALDVVTLKSVGSPQLSEDGQRVVYLVGTAAKDPSAKPSDSDLSGGWKSHRQLFLVARTGGEPRQLTFGQSKVSAPRWGPEPGMVTFRRAGTLHVLPVDGGEAAPVDTGSQKPGRFAWSPDGRTLAFTATPRADAKRREARWRTGGVQTRGEEFDASHLFVMARSGGAPRALTSGKETVLDFRWAPDGERIAAAVAPTADPYDRFFSQSIRIVAAADGKLLARIADKKPPSSAVGMQWSPDGRYLAHVQTGGADPLSFARRALVVHDLEAKTSTDVAAGQDLSLAGFVWEATGRSVLAHVVDRTRSRLVRLPLGGKPAARSPRYPGVLGRRLQADGAARWAVTVASSPTRPWEVAVVDLSTLDVERITDTNPQVRDWTLGKTEVVRWKSPEGMELEGVLTVTPHPPRSGPPPLLVWPHGGPQWVSREGFDARAQHTAARGYSVFQPNYRGGVGYGDAFFAANRGRLGEIEHMDIEAGVDHLIAQGKADPKRLYYGGWSWGGYLATWALTHTNRYRAAVVGAGVVDVATNYAVSDINRGLAAQWEFRGDPWRQPERFAASNPVGSLHRAKTPTLILHGLDDHRVPFFHARILYRALSDVGCEVRLYAYPGEGHGVVQPAHRLHVLDSVTRWLDAH